MHLYRNTRRRILVFTNIRLNPENMDMPTFTVANIKPLSINGFQALPSRPHPGNLPKPTLNYGNYWQCCLYSIMTTSHPTLSAAAIEDAYIEAGDTHSPCLMASLMWLVPCHGAYILRKRILHRLRLADPWPESKQICCALCQCYSCMFTPLMVAIDKLHSQEIANGKHATRNTML